MHRSLKFQGLALASTLAASAFSGAAWSADSPGTAPAVQAVIQCRAITEATQRLACYDKTVSDMAGANAKGDLLTLDKEQRSAIRHQAFGFTMPSFTVFDRGEKPEEVSRASFKVAQAWQDLEGHWNIKLETGAVWRQTDTNELYRDPHAGSVADINKAALSGYFMKLDGQQAIRVMRIS